MAKRKNRRIRQSQQARLKSLPPNLRGRWRRIALTCAYGTSMREVAAIKAAYATYRALMFTREKLALLEKANTLTERMDLLKRTPEAQAAWDRWCKLGAARTKRIYSKSPLYVAKAATILNYWEILFLDDQGY